MEALTRALAFLHALVTALVRPFAALAEPDSFLYWPFLLSTVLVAVLAWRCMADERPRWRVFLGRQLGRELWWHRSARSDYVYYLVNALLFPLLFGPLLFSNEQLSQALMHYLGPAAPGAAVPGWGALTAYTVVFFIVYDAGRFVAHSLMHDVPLLWEFHKVHHSAEVLTPLTAFRFHPVELAVTGWVVALGTGMATWLFHRYVDGAIGVYTFMGSHVLLFVFNLVGNLNHSHVWLSYGARWNRWLISPAHHQLHHSTAAHHRGCNRGFNLALWDRLHGTLLVPPQKPETLSLGLGDGSDGQWHHWWRLYLWPFMMALGRPPATLRQPEGLTGESTPGGTA